MVVRTKAEQVRTEEQKHRFSSRRTAGKNEGLQSVSAQTIIAERMARIKPENIRMGKARVEVLSIDDLSILLAIPKPTFWAKIYGKTEYEHTFADGTTKKVECTFGSRSKRLFYLTQATELAKAIIEEEQNVVCMNEIASRVQLSRGTIENLFERNGGQILAQEEGTERAIKLRMVAGGTTNRPGAKYLLREELVLFEKWLAEHYEGDRNWHGEISVVVPAGYVDVQGAAEILGEDRAYIDNKMASKKLAAEKYMDRIWIIPLEEIERFKKERNAREPPPNCTRVWRMLRDANINRHTYKTNLLDEDPTKPAEKSIETRKPDKYFRLIAPDGTKKYYPVYEDMDGEWWIGADTRAEIHLLTGKTKEMIEKREVAKILEIKPRLVEVWLDREKRVLSYVLPDGNIYEVPYRKKGQRNVFDRAEVLVAKARRDELLAQVRFGPDIAKELGVTENYVHQLFIAGNGRISFILNGKNHEIVLKRNSKGQIYLMDEETKVLAVSRKIRSQETHYPLEGEYLCDTEEKLRRLRIEREGITLHEDQYGRKVLTPLDELDGRRYVKKEYADLVRFYLETHSLVARIRIHAVEAFSQTKLDSKDIVVAKVLILKDIRKNETDAQICESIDRILSDPRVPGWMLRGVQNQELTNSLVPIRAVVNGHADSLRMRNGMIVLSTEYSLGMTYTHDGNDISVTRDDARLLKLQVDLTQGDYALAYLALNAFLDEMNFRKKSKGNLWTARDAAALGLAKGFVFNRATVDDEGHLIERLEMFSGVFKLNEGSPYVLV